MNNKYDNIEQLVKEIINDDMQYQKIINKNKMIYKLAMSFLKVSSGFANKQVLKRLNAEKRIFIKSELTKLVADNTLTDTQLNLFMEVYDIIDKHKENINIFKPFYISKTTIKNI